MTTRNSTLGVPAVGSRLLWYVEYWALNRIDAWGAAYVVGALVLIAHHMLTLQTFLLMMAITTNYWLGYWLNDYFDAPYDRNDDDKAHHNIFIQRPIPHWQVWTIVGVIFLFSAVPFLSFGWRGALILLVSYMVMWAYSAPPFRLKSKPGLDLLTHALFVQSWPYFVCMWLTQTQWTLLDLLLVGICFLGSLSGQLNQQIRDFAVDAATDSNFTTRVGVNATMILLRISATGAIALFLLGVGFGYISWLFVPLGFLSVPKLAHHLIQRFNNTVLTFPRRSMYVIMILVLLYINALLIFN